MLVAAAVEDLGDSLLLATTVLALPTLLLLLIAEAAVDLGDSLLLLLTVITALPTLLLLLLTAGTALGDTLPAIGGLTAFTDGEFRSTMRLPSSRPC